MKIFEVIACSVLSLVFFPVDIALAVYEKKELKTPAPKIEVKKGDRIVFVGNSLFESDLDFGYIEFALSSGWAASNLTFRNLGWSGDTVFGDARGYYTNPPGPYALMIKQIKDARPTHVFLAYGAIESEAGESGVPAFKKGLNRLLDSLQVLNAQAVLLSPLPPLTKAVPEKLSQRRNDLKLYASVLSSTATERGISFVDIFKPFEEIQLLHKVSDDGVHLNERGYYHLASFLENGLGLSRRNWSVHIAHSAHGTKTDNSAEILEADGKTGAIKFSVKGELLPFPLPFPGNEVFQSGRKLRITGLKRGYYSLSANGIQVTAASAQKWAEGVDIKHGPYFEQASILRKLIIEKNKLFFQQYRPPNRTYILGFRAYEQGRHVRGLEELGLLINWLEGQIETVRMINPNIYQLSPIQ